MNSAVHHPDEARSNEARDLAARFEPRALRTYTPTQAVVERSAGVFHWTAEGRRLYDFSSGVLVANLGHNPALWRERYVCYLGGGRDHWPQCFSVLLARAGVPDGTVGASDHQGAYPAIGRVTVPELAATLYRLLGINTNTDLHIRPFVGEAAPVVELI
jgi:Protein of unknown function (DUF1501)